MPDGAGAYPSRYRGHQADIGYAIIGTARVAGVYGSLQRGTTDLQACKSKALQSAAERTVLYMYLIRAAAGNGNSRIGGLAAVSRELQPLPFSPQRTQRVLRKSKTM